MFFAYVYGFAIIYFKYTDEVIMNKQYAYTMENFPVDMSEEACVNNC